MYITYSSAHEILVTTPEHEHETLKEWFIEGGRNVDEWDREEHPDSTLCIETYVSISG